MLDIGIWVKFILSDRKNIIINIHGYYISWYNKLFCMMDWVGQGQDILFCSIQDQLKKLVVILLKNDKEA